MWKTRVPSFSQMDRSMVMITNERGQVWVPMVVLMGILICLGIGTLVLRVKYRASVQTQRRLDQCVQAKTLQLRDLQNQIEKSNQRIKAERIAAAAALAGSIMTPAALEAVQAIRTVIQAEARIQDALLLRWKWEQAQWAARRGCDSRDDPSPLNLLPEPKWYRDPPDLIGEKALVWRGRGEKTLAIRLSHEPRRSSSEVYSNDKNHWNARWSPFFGPITH